MPLPTGSPLAGDDSIRAALERAIGFQYDIIRLLGRGGMGAVYHAHEKALDRPVAIKVLPPDTAMGDARERFLREARTAARLTHPNIVPLLTFGETQGLIYYVMGYVDGESLEQRLRRVGKLDPDTAADILAQLANALDYAHQQGIVHRDVKPDNILIDSTGTPKLTDFGIAKRTAGGETLTGTGMLIGTPRYMSPEQASGDRDIGARSDVYALGLVGYAMLTGRPPFDGSSVQEILTQHVTRDAPSLRKLFPDLASALVVSVERALKKDPAQRWPTAGAMAAALSDEDGAATDGSAVGTTRKPGTYAIVNLVSVLVALDLVWWASAGGRMQFLWLAPLTVVGFAADYLLMRFKEKRSPAEIRRVFTEPPQWWPLWWPARWRRRDDVWARLPRALRRLRWGSTIGFGAFAVSMQAIFMALTHPSRGLLFGMIIAVGLSMLPVALLALFGTAAGITWWGRKQGLTPIESARIARAPTGRAKFWKQPWAARFLQQADVERQQLEPGTPAALADAIGALVRQLPPLQQDAVGGAEVAARALAVAIDAIDTEVSVLTRDADPAELERLESRIASLGAESQNDSPGQREMRQLYSSQLDLLRRLARQSQDLGVRRARYAELLRTLWLQLSALRADQAQDAIGMTDASGRIKHIVQTVEREVEGARDARALVTQS